MAQHPLKPEMKGRPPQHLLQKPLQIWLLGELETLLALHSQFITVINISLRNFCLFLPVFSTTYLCSNVLSLQKVTPALLVPLLEQ